MAGKIRLASSGGDIKIWDMPELSMVKAFSPHSQPVGSLCWSPNGQCLASAANDKVVVTYIKGDVYDTAEINAGEGNTCVAFNSSSRYLLTGGKGKTLNIWDMKTKSIKKTYKDHKDVVSCVTFNWNDTSIASGSVNGDILLHNVISGQASDPLRLVKTQAVRDIQFSHFKKSLLGAVSDDSALNLWDSNTRKLFTSFASDHKAPATGLSFSPMNDMLLCSVGLDKRIVFYDVQGKKSVKVMTAEAPLTSVDFMSDGATLAVGSTRGKIYIYDLRSGSTPVSTTVAHKTSVQSLAFRSLSKVNNAPTATSKGTRSSAVLSGRPLKPSDKPDDTSIPPPSLPTPMPEQQDNTVHTPVIKQNGIKEDSEDIFSPLREIKTPVVNSRQAPVTGSNNFKENNPPDGSGVFSPIRSNLSLASSTEPQQSVSSTITVPDSPRTLGVTTASVSTPSSSKYARSSTRSLTEVGTVKERSHDGMSKSHSDTKLITRPPPDASLGGNLIPSATRHQSQGEYSSGKSHVTELDGDDRQPFSGSLPSSGNSRPSKPLHSPLGSPSQSRGTVEAAGVADQFLAHTRTELQGAQSLIFDSIKHSIEPLPSGAVAMAPPNESATDEAVASSDTAGMLPFQVQFIKNLIDESLDEFRVAIHRDFVNLQVEMLRQFQIQQNEVKGIIEKYSVNESLVKEIERLKEENNRLKSKY